MKAGFPLLVPLSLGFAPLYRAIAAAAAAIALYQGKKPKVNGQSKGKPALIIPVSAITKANYTRLFRDGVLKRSEVCTGEYKKYCK